jgi:hypothetical protein
MKRYFTINGGRTGSAWLADFLSINLQIQAVHEPLGIDDFGVSMPDIRTQRNFNTFGNNDFVQAFWERKLSSLPPTVYAETNHTLCKSGLVENLILQKLQADTTLILLSRDIVNHCLSFVVRNDFAYIANVWQFLLDQRYAKNLISPIAFQQFKGIGTPLWYCYEMWARQEYYVQKFFTEIEMHIVTLEDITKIEGAKKLHKALGLDGDCLIPPPKNQNQGKPSDQLRNLVSDAVHSISVDMPQLIEDKIKKGFSFDAVQK